MALKKNAKIWFNGKLVKYQDATVHVLAHALHYGSSAFEGIRCYETPDGPAVFRLSEHMKRLLDSCKIYNIKVKYSQKQLEKAALDTIKANKLKSCYIRPLIFRGYGEMGVNPLKCPVEAVIAVWEWGKYLGAGALEKGVDVRVSSWTRVAPNTMPNLAKVASNYMNSQLMKMEAIRDGYVESVALDVFGNVCEGSGENMFFVYDGQLLTPPLGGSVLAGITRASVITIARDMGLTVVEQAIPREMLYIADEIFFTGTAAELTPINSVDGRKVGRGGRGKMTAKIQKRFLEAVDGRSGNPYGWLTYVK